MPVLLICAAFAVCILTGGCSGEKTPPAEPAQEEPPAQSGEEAAGTAAGLGSLRDFTAGTLDGGTFTQEDIAAKDVTIVNFWGLTCGPCIAEMPDLAAFAVTETGVTPPYFCRYLCLLGAFYALFNRFSFFQMRLDKNKYVGCGHCEEACPMAVEVTKNINSPECIRCGACRAACPAGAITAVFGRGERTASREPATPESGEG